MIKRILMLVDKTFIPICCSNTTWPVPAHSFGVPEARTHRGIQCRAHCFGKCKGLRALATFLRRKEHAIASHRPANSPFFTQARRNYLEAHLPNQIYNIRQHIGKNDFVVVHGAELAKPDSDWTPCRRNTKPIMGKGATKSANFGNVVLMTADQDIGCALEVGKGFAQGLPKTRNQRVNAIQIVDWVRTMPYDVGMHKGSNDTCHLIGLAGVQCFPKFPHQRFVLLDRSVCHGCFILSRPLPSCL